MQKETILVGTVLSVDTVRDDNNVDKYIGSGPVIVGGTANTKTDYWELNAPAGIPFPSATPVAMRGQAHRFASPATKYLVHVEATGGGMPSPTTIPVTIRVTTDPAGSPLGSPLTVQVTLDYGALLEREKKC